MVVYEPLWDTLKNKGMTTYALIHQYGYSSHTIHRLRHNQDVSSTLINDLCILLDCKVEDILRFVPDEGEGDI